jgi:ABC-type sugar transport system ATPase subunit
VFLMDEPLSNLDAKLRVQMRADIAELQARLGVTTVYVTHDQAEAMTLGNRVAVMNNGRLQQFDAPRALYERPVNTFVAGFIGSPTMNLVPVPVANGSVSLGGVKIPVPAGEWSTIVVGVRPESLQLAPEGIPARVDVVEEIGADAFVFCTSDVGGGEAKLVARSAAKSAPERGERVALRPVPEDAHVFDPATGARLG